MLEKNPIVSVCFITFNQENYIRKSLDSILNQKTTFKFEIIIHDDCSSDNTPQIIKEYEEKYPHIIKTIFQKENQYSKGMSPLFDFISPLTEGKYIAILEGDDYWCDQNKLQLQVEALEAHNDCFLCVHDTQTVDKCGNLSKYKFPPIDINQSVILSHDYIHYEIAEEQWMFQTSSYMVKADIFKKYAKEKKKIYAKEFYRVGDLPLVLYCLNYGNVCYINKVMSNYRVDSGGHMTKMNLDNSFLLTISNSFIKALESYNEFSDFKFNDDILLGIKKRKFRKCLTENNYKEIFTDYYLEVLNLYDKKTLLFYKFLAINPILPRNLKRLKRVIKSLQREDDK